MGDIVLKERASTRPISQVEAVTLAPKQSTSPTRLELRARQLKEHPDQVVTPMRRERRRRESISDVIRAPQNFTLHMVEACDTAAPVDVDLDLDLDVTDNTNPVCEAEACEQTNGEDADVTVSENTAQGCESTGEFCEDPRSSPSRLTSVTGAAANTVAWSTL